MKKISVTAWLKMIVIVGIHLCIVGGVVYCYWDLIEKYSLIAWGYLTCAYDVCVRWVIDIYSKMPSPQRLADGCINILKLQPFTK